MAYADDTFAAPSPRAWRTSTLRTRDGVDLALYHWPADGTTPDANPARATVALVHGLAEHAGRHEALARRLGAAGIELFTVDLRGHGRSPGERAWIDRFDQYLLDVEALLDAAAHDGLPLFLMGHSMGGAISALYAVERLAANGPPCAGLILSSPALTPGRDVPRWMIAASRLISHIWPRYPALKLDETLLSRDAAVVAANRADPLVYHGKIPARTGAETLEAMRRIERGRAGLRMPVLVYHGTADRVTEPEGSREFSAQVGSADRTLVMYEGSYHETMNDFDRERVIDRLIDWILKRA